MYHGFHDYVLRNVLSPPELIGRRDPTSAGMLSAAVDATLVCRYNDEQQLEDLLEQNAGEVAAVIIEPIAHNSPSILPVPGFLERVRSLCTEHDIVLIFDEVITGIRHHLGGYQAICDVRPDLTTVAKALGNGFPVAGVAGRAEHLERFNTTATGDVTFAGTTNGSLVGLAAASAVIEECEQHDVHEHVYALGDRMRAGLRSITAELGVPAIVSGYGSLYTVLFMQGELRSYDDVPRNNARLLITYRRELVKRGVFEMPENLGRNHICFAHTRDDIDLALTIAHEAMQAALDASTVHA